MKGFRHEKALWDYLRPRLAGKWERIEVAVGPEGFFDTMGTYNGRLIFVERKIADVPDKKLIEPGQIEFAKWMLSAGHSCYYIWGGRSTRAVQWTEALASAKLPFVRCLVAPDFFRPSARSMPAAVEARA